ncbi:MAG TPA: chloride channel protein [Bacteroidia bacterium]|jgi:CIC family chloride channel protein|nr:chloride channel protein [Bacteroidia bacterium]
MNKKINSASTHDGIPISVSIGSALEAEHMKRGQSINLTRLLYICFLSVLNALLVGVIAKLMVYLIGFVTGISFYGTVSSGESSPVGNHLGIWVILVPVIGGVIVGFMARYGSMAIRGHGIPEAMEQVLTNESKIKPIVTLLKPLSAAVSIGTGGPFGAEGPIIAAGGAFGSLIGQLLRITAYERKVLLTAGATAGMAAIFGSPVAGIMLAIELLLFEFSPRSIIPVALACITGAACHILFFGLHPMFSMPYVPAPDQLQLVIYILIGALVGLASVGVTKLVYLIEDGFEKLPIHWMWWPAIGGVAVGVVGYFAPSTMGVGYSNISGILSGSLSINMLLVFCILKFVSWSISLGSGTSGGTLAPLFTIGGALGALIAIGINMLFPSLGLSASIAGLIGMAAMFSGASRAFLTAVIFSLETTQQPHLILPLLGGCAAAYFMSFALMKSTIMTEKIGRRGVNTPDSYMPDVLHSFSVKDVLKEEINILDADNTIAQARRYIDEAGEKNLYLAFAVVDEKEGDSLLGVISMQQIFSSNYIGDEVLRTLVKHNPVIVHEDDMLQKAMDEMLEHKVDMVPVVSKEEDQHLKGILTYRDVMQAYELRRKESVDEKRSISVRKKGIRVIAKGRRWIKRH